MSSKLARARKTFIPNKVQYFSTKLVLLENVFKKNEYSISLLHIHYL